MSEEEKKAIESVKNMFEGITLENLRKDSKMTIYSLGIADILLFLNVFEKQSKEIEELKNADLTIVYMDGFYDGKNKIKDKIKAKIEEYKKRIEELRDSQIFTQTEYEGAIQVLQSLLEEE